ncbi:acyltransferase [Microbacterium enclense]|uniref:Acyltransferase n=1 Tax=Microbacterium enclense TaxID=993073 RepID=A0A3S3P4W1_9MICO|nr:acyltransferase family protein [Microbacterium enclense]RWR19178.1 acyltransferase [Microbacterium enclense]
MASGSVSNRGWLTKHVTNPTSRRNIRPDIQGLRMVAVVAVVLDHSLHWPSGGFVGVDVFFVISGFLITGILLREHEKTGHISFVGFYKRRIRRIVPAATVVLVATVVAAYFIFNKARFAQTGWDAFWAFFFGANWRFAIAGTDYFQATGPVSPLQHFWSLSVEEQFYFVWPWVMLGVLALAALRGDIVRRRTVTGIVMVVFVAVSLWWAFVQSTGDPTIAYFSTLTRAWELGVGALVAIAAPWWAAIPRAMRPILGWMGLLAILASYVVIDDTSPFPAPWALLPVLATALVIVAGTGGEQRFLFPLTNPLSFYIGNISYSLYLWHFPVIIFIGVLIPDEGTALLVSLTLAVLLSVASYHLIETPVQNSPWLAPRDPELSPRARRRVAKHAWDQWWEDHRPRYAYGLLAGSAAALILVVMSTNVPARTSVAADRPTVVPTTSASPTPGVTTVPLSAAQSDIQGQIITSLNATTWPELDPSMDSVIGGPQTPSDVAACGQVESLPIEQCTWGDEGAGTSVMLVGDSVSLAYTEAFRKLSGEAGWTISTRGMFGCPFVDIAISNAKQEIVDACGTHNLDTISMIKERKPTYVVVTATYEVRVTDDSDEKIEPGRWKDGLLRYLDQIKDDTKIVLLAPPPSSVNVQDCYTPQSEPSACVSDITDQYESTAKVEAAAAESINGVYVDVADLFCYDGACPSFIGTTPVKLDLVHITEAYAGKVAPALLDTLRADGVT